MELQPSGHALVCVPELRPAVRMAEMNISGTFHLLHKSGRQHTHERQVSGALYSAVSLERDPVLQSKERRGGYDVVMFSFKFKKS